MIGTVLAIGGTFYLIMFVFYLIAGLASDPAKVASGISRRRWILISFILATIWPYPMYKSLKEPVT